MSCEDALYFNILSLGYEELICSNRADLLFEKITGEARTFDVVIVDFAGLKDVSAGFFKKYIRLKCMAAQQNTIKVVETFEDNNIIETKVNRNLVIYEINLNTYLRKQFDKAILDYFGLVNRDDVIVAQDLDNIENFDDILS